VAVTSPGEVEGMCWDCCSCSDHLEGRARPQRVWRIVEIVGLAFEGPRGLPSRKRSRLRLVVADAVASANVCCQPIVEAYRTIAQACQGYSDARRGCWARGEVGLVSMLVPVGLHHHRTNVAIPVAAVDVDVGEAVVADDA
jgi:hypothetical protein